MIHDINNVTQDKWHMICDLWQVTCDEGWTFSQNFNFLAFMVLEGQWSKDFEKMDVWLAEWMNELIINKGVCRTALATPGLQNISLYIVPRNWSI